MVVAEVLDGAEVAEEQVERNGWVEDRGPGAERRDDGRKVLQPVLILARVVAIRFRVPCRSGTPSAFVYSLWLQEMQC